MQVFGVFEDHLYKRFYPLTKTKPLYFLKLGCGDLVDLYSRSLGERIQVYFLRKELEKLFRNKKINPYNINQPLILLNGRFLPNDYLIKLINEASGKDLAFITPRGLPVVLSLVSPKPIKVARRVLPYASINSYKAIQRHLKVEILDAYFLDPLENWSRYLLKSVEFVGKKIGRGVEIGENVKFDTSEGPISLGENVRIEDDVILKGPLYIGDNSCIREGSTIIKSIVGEECSINGFFNRTVLQGKVITGEKIFLERSIVGEKVYIGSYSFIVGKPSHEIIIADYVYIGPNTTIPKGTRIGIGSAVYGYLDRDIGDFYYYADGVILKEKKKRIREIDEFLKHFFNLSLSEEEKLYFLRYL